MCRIAAGNGPGPPRGAGGAEGGRASAPGGRNSCGGLAPRTNPPRRNPGNLIGRRFIVRRRTVFRLYNRRELWNYASEIITPSFGGDDFRCLENICLIH